MDMVGVVKAMAVLNMYNSVLIEQEMGILVIEAKTKGGRSST
jgi:hypothetical protein